MTTTRTTAIACAFALATGFTVGACGGSEQPKGGSPSGPFSTGIAGTKTLGSLTDSEMQTLCAANAAFARTVMTPEMACRAGAIGFAGLSGMSPTATDAQIQQTCAMIYGMCMAGGPSGGAPATADAGANTCAKPDATCTATVAEYETCMNDSKTAMQQAMSSAPACEALTVAWVKANSGDAGSSSVDPPSCQAIKAKCPGWQAPSSSTTGP
jgi:hypothetical protein